MFVVVLILLVFYASPGYAAGPFATFERASEPVLNDPHDLTFGPDGRLYVADKFGNRIVVMDPNTLEVIETFGDGELPGVHDISFGPDGKAYVAATGLNAVVSYWFVDGVATVEYALGQFPRTEGALAHSNGKLYVMASGIGMLVAMENGKSVAAVQGLPGAHDVAEGLDGSIWVADTGRARLVQFSPSLDVMTVLDDVKYGLIGPRYMDVDDFGRLVVADQDAHRVLMIDPVTGDLIGVIGDDKPGIGPGKFDDPEGVAVRGNSFYFSDSDNNRVVKYVVVVN
ncbi:MAG: DNA-binding beta-propeller fold protein YncE [Paracoccaceae bacterium]|jgi:DNA-binding beta-propeller fold protein YncE